MTDHARRLLAERGLAPTAFEHLTVDAFMTLPFEALAPVKTLLKRYLSAGPWGPPDDEALADAVGPGRGHWQRRLDPDLLLDYGWEGGRFGIRLRSTAAEPGSATAGTDPLAGTFDGPVVPEATPNPRTIRFAVGPVHSGESRWYESAAAADDDPPVARLFREFPEVANVLVGRDFVAVGLHRAADWERLLRPVLAVVTDEFAAEGEGVDVGAGRAKGGPAGAGRAGPATAAGPARMSRLEVAWRELGGLRPGDPDDLAAVREAAGGDDPFRRQVAANLLGEADPAVAAEEWARLVGDRARGVRRAAVDAMVDAGREELRALLEVAVGDTDAWVRWKALRGLAELGAGPSRTAVEAATSDADFRVRLEAAAALRTAGPG